MAVAVTTRVVWRGANAQIDPARGLAAPVTLILMGVLFLVNANYSYTLIARHASRNMGNGLLVFGGVWLSVKAVGIAGDFVVARLKRTHSSEKIALAALLRRLAQIAVVTVGLLIALYLAGVNLTAGLAGLGIGGVAIAFAAQKTIENLFGGIMIISDQPVRIGDVCRIADVTGTVVDIGLRSTRIRTRDRTIVTFPNGQIAAMSLENYTLRDKFWFHPIIALRRQTTHDQMQSILRNIREMLLKQVQVEAATTWVRLIRVGVDSQDIEICAYITTGDNNAFLEIQEQLLLHILDIVESAGTALAVPAQITHIIHQSDATVQKPSEQKVLAPRAFTRGAS